MELNAQSPLTEQDVRAIWLRLDRMRHGCKDDSQRAIAEQYRVSKKTISRIATKTSWGKLTDRIDRELEDLHKTVVNVIVPSTPSETAQLWNEADSIKRAFCFDVNAPLHWGMYDSWDGVQHVATDGFIAWKSVELYNLARKLHSMKINEPPFMSSESHELNTWGLALLLDTPLGVPIVNIEMTGTGVAKAPIAPFGVRYIPEALVKAAKTKKYRFYTARNRSDVVLLAKISYTNSDPEVVAVIATFGDEPMPIETDTIVPMNDIIPVVEVVVTERILTPVNQEKLDVMKDSLHLLDNQDIDGGFLAIMNFLVSRGFRLKHDPHTLLNQIERKHKNG